LGATFPYSEFSGFSRLPRFVTNPLSVNLVLSIFRFLDVGINFKKKVIRESAEAIILCINCNYVLFLLYEAFIIPTANKKFWMDSPTKEIMI